MQPFPVLWLVEASVLCLEGLVDRGFETSPSHRTVSVGKQIHSASYRYLRVCQWVPAAYRWG